MRLLILGILMGFPLLEGGVLTDSARVMAAGWLLGYCSQLLPALY